MKESEGRAEKILGEILSEVIDRRRSGERPSASEYIQKHPDLRDAIEADFNAIEMLEALPANLLGPEAGHPGAEVYPPIAGASAGPSSLEHPDDPVVLAAFRNLRTALSDPKIRPAVLSALQAFADAARRDEEG